MPPTPPSPHFASPYARPRTVPRRAQCLVRPDGARIAFFVYKPGDENTRCDREVRRTDVGAAAPLENDLTPAPPISPRSRDVCQKNELQSGQHAAPADPRGRDATDVVRASSQGCDSAYAALTSSDGGDSVGAIPTRSAVPTCDTVPTGSQGRSSASPSPARGGTGASTGIPVLFLHGNGEEHGIFGPQIDAVVALGGAAIGIDSRAQGKSTRGTARLTYDLMAEDALAVLDSLRVDRAHVVGFSDGAIEALLLARDHSDRVASVVSIGANLTPEGVDNTDFPMQEIAEQNEAWAEWLRSLGTLAARDADITIAAPEAYPSAENNPYERGAHPSAENNPCERGVHPSAADNSDSREARRSATNEPNGPRAPSAADNPSGTEAHRSATDEPNSVEARSSAADNSNGPEASPLADSSATNDPSSTEAAAEQKMAPIDPALLSPSADEAQNTADLMRLMMEEPHIDPRSLAAVSCPVAVVAGEFDVIYPQETIAIHKAIPTSELFIVPDCGHSIPKHAPASVTWVLLHTMGRA